MDQDKLRREYGRLQAVRNNVPDTEDVDEDYIGQYNDLVTSLQQTLEIDLSEFLVLNAKKKQGASILYPGRPPLTSYSETAYSKKSFFLSKIDGLLNYLQFSFKGEDIQIGFRP